MANPSYLGLAGSLARARKPPAQNDVYMHNTPGSGRPPQQFGGGAGSMFDPNKLRGPNQSGFYSNDSIVRGGPQRGGGLGGVAGIDILGGPGAFQNQPGGFGNSPPSGGMSFGSDARPPPAFGGGPMLGGGMGHPGFGGGPTPAPFPSFGGGPVPGGGVGGYAGPGQLDPFPSGTGGPGFGGGPALDPTRRLQQPTGGIRPPGPPYP